MPRVLIISDSVLGGRARIEREAAFFEARGWQVIVAGKPNARPVSRTWETINLPTGIQQPLTKWSLAYGSGGNAYWNRRFLGCARARCHVRAVGVCRTRHRRRPQSLVRTIRRAACRDLRYTLRSRFARTPDWSISGEHSLASTLCALHQELSGFLSAGDAFGDHGQRGHCTPSEVGPPAPDRTHCYPGACRPTAQCQCVHPARIASKCSTME